MKMHENFLERTVLVLGTEHAGTCTLVHSFVKSPSTSHPDDDGDDDERTYEAQLAALSRSHEPVLAVHARRPLVDAGVDIVFKFIHVPRLDMVHAARYTSAAAIVYVYDATSTASLATLEYLLESRGDRALSDISVRALVGNKCDVIGAERTEAAAAALAERYSFTIAERCSATRHDNIDATLDRLGEKLLALATQAFVERESKSSGWLRSTYNSVVGWLIR